MYNNIYTIEGRLGINPEVLESKNTGENFCILSVARANSRYNEASKTYEQLEPDWFKIKVFGTLADRSLSLCKGDLITVSCLIKPIKDKNKNGDIFNSYGFTAKDIRKTELLPKASMASKLAVGHSVDSVFGVRDEL